MTIFESTFIGRFLRIVNLTYAITDLLSFSLIRIDNKPMLVWGQRLKWLKSRYNVAMKIWKTEGDGQNKDRRKTRPHQVGHWEVARGRATPVQHRPPVEAVLPRNGRTHADPRPGHCAEAHQDVVRAGGAR